MPLDTSVIQERRFDTLRVLTYVRQGGFSSLVRNKEQIHYSCRLGVGPAKTPTPLAGRQTKSDQHFAYLTVIVHTKLIK